MAILLSYSHEWLIFVQRPTVTEILSFLGLEATSGLKAEVRLSCANPDVIAVLLTCQTSKLVQPFPRFPVTLAYCIYRCHIIKLKKWSNFFYLRPPAALRPQKYLGNLWLQDKNKTTFYIYFMAFNICNILVFFLIFETACGLEAKK